MKKILECLKLILHYFPVITVVIMIVSAGYVTFFWGADENVSIALLWQILLVSLICSVSPLFFYQRKPKEIGKVEFWLRWVLCYVYVNVIVLSFGVSFDWFDPSKLPMVIGMLLAIAIAFVIIAGFVFLVDKKTADAMNQKLKERNKEQ